MSRDKELLQHPSITSYHVTDLISTTFVNQMSFQSLKLFNENDHKWVNSCCDATSSAQSHAWATATTRGL